MQDLLFELVFSRRAKREAPLCPCVCVRRRAQSANPCPVPSSLHLFLRMIRFDFSTSYSPLPTLSRERLAIKILAGGKCFIMHMIIP